MSSNHIRVPGQRSHSSVPTLRRYDPLKKLFQLFFEILPPGTRGHVVAVLGELISTIMFIFLFFSSIEVANVASFEERSSGRPFSTAQVFFIALSAGFAFIATGWTFYRISGGLFNPIVCYCNSSILKGPR